ncbi:MAG TPA: hypothetical protein VHD36_19240 [Pirellulales bacterium]|nr:hypothetical protein [Pirellulales bacterium]
MSETGKESGGQRLAPLLRVPQVAPAKGAQKHLVPPIGLPRVLQKTVSFYDTCAALLPGWLSSLLVHLGLAILLGVLVVKVPASPGPSLLSFEVGGGSGQGETTTGLELNRTLAERGDASATEIQVASPPQPADEIDAKLSIEVIELAIPEKHTDGRLAESALHSTQEILGGARWGRGGGDGEGIGGEGFGTGHGTAPTKTQVFGVAEEARSFVYVFDHSDSMISTLSYTSEGKTVFSITPLEAAKAELLRSLDDLGANQGFQIVFYNHGFNVFEDQGPSTHLLRGTPENKKRAASFVMSTYGEGSTNHMPALEAALYFRPEAIFLLTDGEAKDDPSQADLAFIRNMNRGRTKINVIHFSLVPRIGGTLAQLAEENRGRHLSFNLSRLGPGMQKAAARERKNSAGNVDEENVGEGNAHGENAMTDPRLRAP